jgi:hypothetical protein
MRNGWLGSVACGVGLVSFVAVGACGGDTDLLTSSVVASAAADAGNDAGVSACQALAECCAASLPASDQAGCEQVVAANDTSVCEQGIAAVQAAGFCGGVGTGVGSGSGSGTSTVPECASLAACCAAPGFPLASQQPCAAIVAEASAASCESALVQVDEAGLCEAGVGSGTGSGVSSGSCAGLTQCCLSLPESEITACQQLASGGDEPLCASELSVLKSEGTCGG